MVSWTLVAAITERHSEHPSFGSNAPGTPRLTMSNSKILSLVRADHNAGMER